MNPTHIARYAAREGCTYEEAEDHFAAMADERRRDEVEQRLIAKGYDLDALERDNPYNQWMQGVQA